MSIPSEITRINNAKTSIKNSIEAKGVTVGTGTIDTYASKIDEIQTGVTPTGTLNINENGNYDVANYANANVSVQGGTNNANIDYSNLKKNNVAYIFQQSITEYPTVVLPLGTTDISSIFSNYKKSIAPAIDTSNVTNFSSSFSSSGLVEAPAINTSNGTSFTSMFISSTKLITLPAYDFSKAINVASVIIYCSNLQNCGGFINLGQAYLTTKSANYSSYTLQAGSSTSWTEQALINILNGLYDIASSGCNTQKVTMGSTNLAKLTSTDGQQALINAQEKGWTIV